MEDWIITSFFTGLGNILNIFSPSSFTLTGIKASTVSEILTPQNNKLPLIYTHIILMEADHLCIEALSPMQN